MDPFLRVYSDGWEMGIVLAEKSIIAAVFLALFLRSTSRRQATTLAIIGCVLSIGTDLLVWIFFEDPFILVAEPGNVSAFGTLARPLEGASILASYGLWIVAFRLLSQGQQVTSSPETVPAEADESSRNEGDPEEESRDDATGATGTSSSC